MDLLSDERFVEGSSKGSCECISCFLILESFEPSIVIKLRSLSSCSASAICKCISSIIKGIYNHVRCCKTYQTLNSLILIIDTGNFLLILLELQNNFADQQFLIHQYEIAVLPSPICPSPFTYACVASHLSTYPFEQ